jgi:hypothetical protein
VWLIFTHEWWSWGEGQRQAMVDFLDRCKVRTETIETRGAWAYRFTTRTLGQGTSAVSSCKVEG